MFETTVLVADVGGVQPEESVDEVIARWRAAEPPNSER